MRLRCGLFCAVLAALSLLPTRGTAAKTTPLQPFFTAVRQALATNSRIMKGQAQLVAAKTLFPQAKSTWLPHVAMSWYSATEQKEDKGEKVQTDPTSLSLSVSQSLLDLEAIGDFRKLTPYVQAVEMDLVAIKQEVLLSLVAEATVLLQAGEVASLAKDNFNVTQKHLHATQVRFTAGELTQTDVSQAQSRVATSQADWIAAEGQVQASRARFQEIVGFPAPLGLQIPSVRTPLIAKPEEALRPLIEDRPDIAAARLRVQVEEANIQARKAGHYPTASLASSGKRTWDPGTVPGPEDVLSLGITLSVPIYSGGLTHAKIDQAFAERDMQKAQLDAARSAALRELKLVLLEYASAQAASKALQTAVRAAKDAMKGVSREYQVGTRTSLDLLDAQNELFTTQTNRVKSRFTVNLALFKFLKAIGRLAMTGEAFQLIPGDASMESTPTTANRHFLLNAE